MENKITIFVCAPYYPPHTGGLENHAHQWNLHMAAKGHRLVVWTPRIPRHGIPKEEISSAITVYRYPAYEIISGYPVPAMWLPSYWRLLRQALFQMKYTVIISRTRFFLSSLVASFLAKSIHVPVIHIEHGSDFVHGKNAYITTIARLYDTSVGRYVLMSATHVVANSRATATFVSFLTKGRVKPRVIYRGVDQDAIDAITPIDRTAISETILCYCGRLVYGKGVHDVIQALARIPHIPIRFWIIGSGAAKKSLEALVKSLGLTTTVHFLGDVTHEKAISYVKASDICINPSYTEGLPTSVIEAALAGTASIATDVGGTSEIISHEMSGILVKAKDIASISQAIEMLATNANMRKALAVQAQHSARNTFSWNHAIEEYEKIFRELHSQN